mgnify:CR=1 FL=1
MQRILRGRIFCVKESAADAQDVQEVNFVRFLVTFAGALFLVRKYSMIILRIVSEEKRKEDYHLCRWHLDDRDGHGKYLQKGIHGPACIAGTAGQDDTDRIPVPVDRAGGCRPGDQIGTSMGNFLTSHGTYDNHRNVYSHEGGTGKFITH